ncbi:methionyl-tRNA formyltransferase [Patescibacteria group bacterium]|nr:methionyl-tRNA formyltransferase [Patescibacteria group bacterium]
MKIIFFGTPEFAKKFLASLHEDEDIFVSAVVCQPDKPVGRRQVLTSSPTKAYALEHDIPILQPETIKNNQELQDRLRSFDVEAFVVVAYGRIIPKSILDIPKIGSLNVHPSLLPKYRGPSPIQSAIASDDRETGITIMLLDDEMDHGPILAQEKIEIDGQATAATLREKVNEIGAPLLIKTLKDYAAGKIELKEQDHDKATYCKILTRQDGIIDWDKPAKVIERKIRAYTPWPGTTTTWNDKTLKIHKAVIPSEVEGFLRPGEVKITDNRFLIGTGTTSLEILEIQPEGKQKMPANAFLNGYKEVDGAVLS